ncbi:hypothetical protein ACMYSN_09575 [Klebsiella sp. R445]
MSLVLYRSIHYFVGKNQHQPANPQRVVLMLTRQPGREQIQRAAFNPLLSEKKILAAMPSFHMLCYVL